MTQKLLQKFKTHTISAIVIMGASLLPAACTQEPSPTPHKTTNHETTNISDNAESIQQAKTTDQQSADIIKTSSTAADGNPQTDEGHDHTHKTNTSPNNIDIDHILTRAPDDHMVGDVNAPNTMIVYASVTCPHCSDWFTHEWPRFKAEQIDTGNTLMVFREIPTQPQQVAMYGFVLANCAPADKYMDHIVYQMENQKRIFEQLQAGHMKIVYDDLSRRAGLMDQTQIQACFANQNHTDRIQRSAKRLAASTASGVPAFIINGEVYKGDTTADDLNAALSE